MLRRVDRGWELDGTLCDAELRLDGSVGVGATVEVKAPWPDGRVFMPLALYVVGSPGRIADLVVRSLASSDYGFAIEVFTVSHMPRRVRFYVIGVYPRDPLVDGAFVDRVVGSLVTEAL